MRSVVVVLPASMCAMIPMLRVFSRGKLPRSGARDPSASPGERPARSPRSRAGRLLLAPLKVGYDVGAILVEVLRIPLRLWLRVAEAAGAAVLALWRVAWPPMIALA